MKNDSETGSANDQEQALFPIIGLGYSAGGLKALKRFLSGVRSGSKAAYVVIHHLPEEGESQLHGILKEEAPLPLHKLADGQKPKSGHIYILSVKADVVMDKDLVRFTENSDPGGNNNSPIDRFFGSLARDKAEMVVGVILSGSGTDGTV
ncbi:MAG TPA: chemotaxis protein CheB, partial [Opitutales bacterium]|nr:chemotaxis protein CheB [Opitutales bacterium]